MTTEVKGDVFERIDVEHQELERQYDTFDAFLRGDTVQIPVLHRRLAELAASLKRHFEHEEQGGYFVEIVEMAPRLCHQASSLESEHAALLGRLQELDQQLSDIAQLSKMFERFRGQVGDFINTCRSHEHRETELFQDAWLTEIGTGD